MKQNTVMSDLCTRFASAIAAVGYGDVDPEITITQNPRYGDFQSNVAHKLPGDKEAIATKIIQNLDLEGVGSASQCNGFINVSLSPDYREQKLIELGTYLALGDFSVEHPKHIVLDYSSPNMAKEMHLGHLRSTLLGEAIARLLELQSHTVDRVSHVGDFGTPMSVLITYIQEQGIETADLTSKQLLALYRQSKTLFDTDPGFHHRVRVAIAQRGTKNLDSPYWRTWQEVCRITRNHFNEIYDILGVNIPERGESTYQSQLDPCLQDLKGKGLITHDDGADCIFWDENEPPLIFKKQDGSYTYAAIDVVALRERLQYADQVLYVTDEGQSRHFKAVFHVVQALDGVEGDRMVHIPFGLVKTSEGKKMSSRSGETLSLLDTLKTYQAKDIYGLDSLMLAQFSFGRSTNYSWSSLVGEADEILSVFKKNPQLQSSFSYPELLSFPELLMEVTRSYSPELLKSFLWRGIKKEPASGLQAYTSDMVLATITDILIPE